MIETEGIKMEYWEEEEGNITCNIGITEDFFNFPLTAYFCVSGPGSIFWSCSLKDKGHWCSYPYARGMDVRILDFSGEIIFNLPWESEVHGDIIERKFIDWCRYFKGKNRYKAPGMVIGAHRGFGEWEAAYNQDLIGECLLIEPNDSPFHSLVSRFQKDAKFSYKKCLVSESGGELEFFTNESGDSESSSLSLDHLSKSPGIEEKKIVSKKIQSFTVESLLEGREIKWIHIDAEGYDYKIILSIPDNILDKVDFIIWEHLFINDEDTSSLRNFFEQRGFITIEGSSYNSCAFKSFIF